MLATRLDVPELALTEDEAGKLAKAVANVASHYEFLGSASPEAQAWAALMFTAATIYGPRAGAVFFNKKAAERNNAAR